MTVVIKSMDQTSVPVPPGSDTTTGTAPTASFSKPLFCTLNREVAMSLSLLVWLCARRSRAALPSLGASKRLAPEADLGVSKPLLGGDVGCSTTVRTGARDYTAVPTKSPIATKIGMRAVDHVGAMESARSRFRRTIVEVIPGALVIAAVFDISAIVLYLSGLSHTTASVSVMLGASELVFNSILTTTVLRRKLPRMQWVGVALAAVGLVVVGIAARLEEQSSPQAVKSTHAFLGIMLILAANVAFAGLNVYIEWLATHRTRMLSPAQTNGGMGAVGTVLVAALILPVAAHVSGSDTNGVWEDTSATIYSLTHDIQALWMMVALFFINVPRSLVLTSVIQRMSSLLYTFVTSLVGLGVLGTEQILYKATDGRLGSKWNEWVPLQVGGFAVVAVGLMIFARGKPPSDA